MPLSDVGPALAPRPPACAARWAAASRSGASCARPFSIRSRPARAVLSGSAASEPDPFTEEERDALLTFFWERKRHYHAFVHVLFATGMRIGEAVGLRWGAIDLRRGTFTVRRSRTLGEDNPPKTAKAERTKRLQPDTIAVLRTIRPLRATEDDFVFTTEVGTPLDAEKFVEKHWRRTLRACDLKPRRLYAARHTFISLALTKGVKTKWLADYCGTSMEMIERHYAKWMDVYLRDRCALKSLARVLRVWPAVQLDLRGKGGVASPLCPCYSAAVSFVVTCAQCREVVLEADLLGDEEECALRDHLLAAHLGTGRVCCRRSSRFTAGRRG